VQTKVCILQNYGLKPVLQLLSYTRRKELTMPTIAFHGIDGAHSQSAIFQFFGPDTKTLSCRDLEEIFESVKAGRADLGILPVENALAGSQPRAYELLMERDLRIQAEVIMHIKHTLMALPGTQLAALKKVRSTLQSLTQCGAFIQRHKLEQVPSFDTASSARDLVAGGKEKTMGVIANKLAANIYGLEILREEIEDAPFNYTRFFVLGNEDPPRAQRSKTSLIFSGRHLPGSLLPLPG